MIDDWAERSLCPDGACTGVIGGDGRCKVCGRVSPFWGDERRRGTVEVSDDDDAPADAGDPVDDERELCSDGACTGVIGDDGHCKECGMPGERPVQRRAARAAAAAQVTRVKPPAVANTDDDDSDDRRLCADGACTGLLDASGVCKVCGRSSEAN